MLSFFYSRFLDILHEAPLSGQRKRTRILGSVLYCFLLVSICSNLQNCCVSNWVSCDLQFRLNMLSFHVPYWSFWEVEEWSSMACGEGHVILFEMGIGESLFVQWYGLVSIPALDWKVFFFFSNQAGFGPFDIGIKHLPGSIQVLISLCPNRSCKINPSVDFWAFLLNMDTSLGWSGKKFQTLD